MARKRWPQDLSRTIGQRLRERGAGKDERRAVAGAMGVRERTVRNWMAASKDPPRKLGRTGYSQKERYHALRAVGRQHRLQGKKAGWRPIDKALCGDVPTALENFRELVKQQGRDPDSVHINIQIMDTTDLDKLKAYRDLGVERATVGVAMDMWDKPDEVMPMIDRFAEIIPELKD